MKLCYVCKNWRPPSRGILVVGRHPRGRREGPPASALDSLIGRDKPPYYPHIYYHTRGVQASFSNILYKS